MSNETVIYAGDCRISRTPKGNRFTIAVYGEEEKAVLHGLGYKHARFTNRHKGVASFERSRKGLKRSGIYQLMTKPDGHLSIEPAIDWVPEAMNLPCGSMETKFLVNASGSILVVHPKPAELVSRIKANSVEG